MRKNSSEAPRGNKQSGKNDFKSNDGRKSFNKDAKPYRKNYDGRQQASGEKPYRSSKPYSGRVADGDRSPAQGDSERRPYGKPGFKGEDNRRPSKDFGKPRRDDRRGGDEPKERKHFGKPFHAKDGEQRKPRKEFDKTHREDKRGPGERPVERKSFGKPFHAKDDDQRKPRREYDKPERKQDGERRFDDRPKRKFDDKRKPFERKEKDGSDKPYKKFDRPEKKKEDTRPFRERTPKVPDEVSFSKDIDDLNPVEEKPFKLKKLYIPKREEEQKPKATSGRKRHYHEKDKEEDDEDREVEQTNGPRLEMPLNKYIAHSGECSRRDAAEMVKQGKVKVNGELVLEPGYRVKHDDKVTLSGKKLTPQKGFAYILLNKPKGFITTNDDPQGRKTVLDLVSNSGVDRLFPVGRLDRETSGLLLLTNDGDLTQKLSHPSYNIKKVYHVTLDKPLTKADFDRILEGVVLDDGKAVVDALAHLESKNEVGLEIHSGRNRIVRRIFESLGYVVEKLDRVMYAGLTKKNLPRSKWRLLTEREIVLLKHFKS